MNPYLQSFNRLEFLLTFACTGRCRHCSEGDHAAFGEHLDGGAAAEAVRKIAGQYGLESLMTFGGEPLLYSEDVCKIHAAAREAGIAKRQLITNGFFSRDAGEIGRVARALAESGVNDILLSVDAFHQETIPMEPVMAFASAVSSSGIERFRVHPAWLAGEAAENPYNHRTREILAQFTARGIAASSGNVIFPSGNALKYLGEYFDLSAAQKSPYTEDPCNIKAVCVAPNGDVLGGNIYQTDILDILERYAPENAC